MRTFRLLMFGLVVACNAPLNADTHIAKLPYVMDAFALNPGNGDMAMIDGSKRVYLFKSKHLRSEDNPRPTAEATISNDAIAICFKRYKSRSFFAVVSARDSHMFLFDAGDLTLVKKIPVAQAGVKSVVSSSNDEDPFIYYNYGGGHDAVAAAVDLRKMSDLGMVVDDSHRFAVSADGKTVYRLGPHSPTGFESLVMTTDFSAAFPRFVRLFYDHASLGMYLTDPFSTYTVVGSSVYTTSLEKKIATLSFRPICFSTKRPLVFGQGTADRSGRVRPGNGIRAASYNTFADIGTPVQLENPTEPKEKDSRRSRTRRPVGVTSMFVDDANDLVIHAHQDKVRVIPLADFDLPNEPFLKLKSISRDLEIGKTHQVVLQPVDPSIELEIDSLPDGCKRTRRGVSWTPTNDQIGKTTLRVALKHSDIQRVLDLDFNIKRPGQQLPFEILGFRVGKSGGLGCAWNSAVSFDKYGKPLQTKDQRFALVDLAFKKQPKVVALPFQIRDARITDRQIVFLSEDDRSTAAIYRLKDLKKEKTIRAKDQIISLDVNDDGSQLILNSAEAKESIDLKSFKPAAPPKRPEDDRFRDGKIVGDLFVDKKTEKAKLFFTTGQIPSVRNLSRNTFSIFRSSRGGFGLKPNQPAAKSNRPAASVRNARDFRRRSSGTIRAKHVKLAGTNISVGLEYSSKAVKVKNAIHTSRMERVVSLEVMDEQGSRLERVFMHRSLRPNTQNGRQSNGPVITTFGHTAYVAVDNEITQWKAPDSYRRSDGEKPVTAQTEEVFYFEPRQSTFVFNPDSSNKLQHKVVNGQGEIEFHLIHALDGMSLLSDSGEIRVDGRKIYQFAANNLIEQLIRYTRRTTIEEEFHNAAIALIKPATKILGRKPTGFPFSIPIHLKAVDSAGNVAELKYFVLVELPFQETKTQLVTTFAKRQEDAQATTANAKTNVSPPDANMKNRLEVLESRIDLLTKTVVELSRTVDELKSAMTAKENEK